MALVTEFVCKVCETPRYEVVVQSRVCVKCRTRIEGEKRLAFQKECDDLTTEQRIRRLELWFYDLNAESRLKALEARTATYS